MTGSTPRTEMKRPLLLLLSILLLAGCTRRPEAGEYELVRTQRGELPALLGERDGCRYEAAAGRVTLTREGRFEAVLARVRNCPDSMRIDTLTDRGEGSYLVEGDSLFFRNDDGIAAGAGRQEGDSLVVVGPGQTMYYRRSPR